MEAVRMKLTDLFLADLEREAISTRRVLERVPEGRDDWKPHEKSMALGYLANLVATMPSWIAMMVTENELDFNPPGGQRYKPSQAGNNRELLEAFDQSVAKARDALRSTNDEHLMTSWRFLTGGRVISDQPRHIVIRDGVLNHLAHHRGQLTVYLRLNDVPVPSIYGPSADERPFG
jgi:uncharacterized damage-inducible protein DinB